MVSRSALDADLARGGSETGASASVDRSRATDATAPPAVGPVRLAALSRMSVWCGSSDPEASPSSGSDDDDEGSGVGDLARARFLAMARAGVRATAARSGLSRGRDEPVAGTRVCGKDGHDPCDQP